MLVLYFYILRRREIKVDHLFFYTNIMIFKNDEGERGYQSIERFKLNNRVRVTSTRLFVLLY